MAYKPNFTPPPKKKVIFCDFLLWSVSSQRLVNRNKWNFHTLCNVLSGWCPSFWNVKISFFFFAKLWSKNSKENGSFSMILGCGASDIKDGWTDFNGTFTNCVICSQHDAHFFKMKISQFYQITAKKLKLDHIHWLAPSSGEYRYSLSGLIAILFCELNQFELARGRRYRPEGPSCYGIFLVCFLHDNGKGYRFIYNTIHIKKN